VQCPPSSSTTAPGSSAAWLACPTLPNIRLYSLPVFIVRSFRPTWSGRTVRDVTVDHDSCPATLTRRNRRRVQGCAVCRRSRQLRRTCWSGMDGSCESLHQSASIPQAATGLGRQDCPCCDSHVGIADARRRARRVRPSAAQSTFHRRQSGSSPTRACDDSRSLSLSHVRRQYLAAPIGSASPDRSVCSFSDVC
jgi:hypothetical protein